MLWRSPASHVTTDKVYVANQDDNTVSVIYDPSVPTTTGLSPDHETAGDSTFTLTVNGTGFITTSVVRWNRVNRTTTYASATQLIATIPAAGITSAGMASVTVYGPTPGGGTSNAQTFTINATTPKVDGVNPTTGSPGTQVTITGSNFGADQGGSSVTIGVVNATVVSWSDTKIVVTVPPGASSGAVVVTTAQGASNKNKSLTVVCPTWYLAEGTTVWGFSTYITIENPNEEAVTARITYMNPAFNTPTGKGVVATKTVSLPAMSQTTINPEVDLLWPTDFSTKIRVPPEQDDSGGPHHDLDRTGCALPGGPLLNRGDLTFQHLVPARGQHQLGL